MQLSLSQKLLVFSWFFGIAWCPPAMAQEFLTGVVVDASTGQPISFVNVGVLEAGLGTVSDAEGRFHLKVPDGALVLFAANGYDTRKIPLQELSPDTPIALTPRLVHLKQSIVVEAQQLGELQTLGWEFRKQGFSLGFGSDLLGAQVAAQIPVRKKTLLKSAHFVVNHTGGRDFLYRVHLYPLQAGQPGEDLLSGDRLLYAPESKGPVVLDLTQENLVVDQNLLLCLEWIQGSPGDYQRPITFRARRRSKGNVYLKSTSHSPFRPLEGVRLGFFLKGWELD